jgi:Response regulator containing a CheY-like receiver domain and an HTH DNA-binding domain
MAMIRVGIAGANKSFAEEIKRAVAAEDDMNVSFTSDNGDEAYDMIMMGKTDILIVNYVLKGMDGIDLTEKIMGGEIDNKPRIIFLSPSGVEAVAKLALDAGAKGFYMTPVSSDKIISKIRNIAEKESYYRIQTENYGYVRDVDLEIEIIKTLHDEGIPSHLLGYSYLKAIISMMVCNKKTDFQFINDLYPEIAKQYGTTPYRIERAIRNAIAKAWSDKYLETKPTATVFIHEIVEKLRLERYIF